MIQKERWDGNKEATYVHELTGDDWTMVMIIEVIIINQSNFFSYILCRPFIITTSSAFVTTNASTSISFILSGISTQRTVLFQLIVSCFNGGIDILIVKRLTNSRMGNLKEAFSFST